MTSEQWPELPHRQEPIEDEMLIRIAWLIGGAAAEEWLQCSKQQYRPNPAVREALEIIVQLDRLIDKQTNRNRLDMFERIARDAKEVVKARQKLMHLMSSLQSWDNQQEVVQEAVRKMEDGINDAEVAGLFGPSKVKNG